MGKATRPGPRGMCLSMCSSTGSSHAKVKDQDSIRRAAVCSVNSAQLRDTALDHEAYINLSLWSKTGIFTRSSGPSFSLGASMMKRRFAACCLIFLLGCVSSKVLYRAMQSCSLPVACMAVIALFRGASVGACNPGNMWVKIIPCQGHSRVHFFTCQASVKDILLPSAQSVPKKTD